jgi:hypothetical protein
VLLPVAGSGRPVVVVSTLWFCPALFAAAR